MESTYTRFLQGDIVTVLPYSDISAQFVRRRELPSGCCFREEMEMYCEGAYVVRDVIRSGYSNVGFYKLSGIPWSFTDEMLTIALPESTNDNVISFDDVMNFDK